MVEQSNEWMGCHVTVVEWEFQHVVRDPTAPDDPARLGPRPDQLYDDLNTPVTRVTPNCLLLCMNDGSAVHADWDHDERVFVRRDDKQNINLSRVRAWMALPSPICGY
jgi:hypothetical protein